MIYWPHAVTMWKFLNHKKTSNNDIEAIDVKGFRNDFSFLPGPTYGDQVNGQRVCLPSLVFTVGLFVASRGRFLSRGRSGEVEQSRRGLQSSSVPRRDHQHSQVDAREARTLDIVISVIIINIIKETTIPNWTLVISFEEDRLFFVNNLPYFFPRSKSISKVS